MKVESLPLDENIYHLDKDNFFLFWHHIFLKVPVTTRQTADLQLYKIRRKLTQKIFNVENKTCIE